MGVTLVIAALLAQASPDVAPPTIMAIEVRLPATADPKLVQSVTRLVTVRRGQPLSRRAVQRSIENLWKELHLSEAVVEVEDVPGGVALIFELVPRVPIREVYVEGTVVLPPADLVVASGLEPDQDFWPERVDEAAEAVRAMYRKRGFLAAKVETRVLNGDDGVSVGFVVVDGPPTLISAITFVGDPGLPLSRLLEVLGLAPGEVLDQTRLNAGADALRAMFKRERYYRARVDSPHIEAGARVVLSMAAGPRYDLVFSGNRQLSDRSLALVVGYDGAELLDEALIARFAGKIARYYRFRGFHEVRVTPSEALRPDVHRAALGFAIEEGEPLRVVDIDFDGNRAVADSELREVLTQVMQASASGATLDVHGTGDPLGLESRAAPVFAGELPAPPLDTVLDEAAWVEAAKAMAALYRERGYLKAAVRLDNVELRGSQARARFVIEEGPQARFHQVRVEGLPTGFTSEVVAAVKLGSPFSTAQLERVRQGVQRELTRQGYLFATLDANWVVDASGRAADCVVTAKSGPQVRVRSILPVGNERTADQVLLARATMVEGAVLDADALFRTQNALMGLGIFRSAVVEVLSPDVAEPLKTVLLKVRERPRLSGEIGVGYFLAEGPRIVFDVAAPNLGGRAATLTAHGQLNFFALSQPALDRSVDVTNLAAWEQLGGRGNVSIGSRSLLPANIGVQLSVLGERVFRPQFHFTRFAGVPTIDWSTTFEIPRLEWVRPRLTLALQYEIEWSSVLRAGSAIDTTNRVDQERLRFRFGSFALQTLRFIPTLDLRDNSLTPTRGLLLQGSAEVVGAISARDIAGQSVVVDFLKASGLVTGYLPILRTVLAVSLRAGRIVPLATGSSTPPVRRFFMGGATSMRGFNEDQLIAEDLREQYRDQVRDCRVLAVKDGCTSAAQAILADRQVPSQGGELFALLKAELRLPVLGALELGLFVEAGNLWLATPQAIALRTIAGGGLRYATPIGPLALDLGVNLAPDVIINEPAVVVHFNIGVF
jgi:outer membrane protein insertion porin family